VNANLKKAKVYGTHAFHILCSGVICLIASSVFEIKWLSLIANIIFIVAAIPGAIWGMNIVTHMQNNPKFSRYVPYSTWIFWGSVALILFTFLLGSIIVFGLMARYTVNEIRQAQANQTVES
jgi:hypothetical protein